MLESRLPDMQRRAAREGIPLRAHLVLTHRCNLSCAHCYQAEHDGAELSREELEGVFRQLAELGTLFLVFGGGEPLSRRDFWELLASARALGFAVEVFTNGTLLDEAGARRLRELGVVRVHLSLHGSASLTHDVFVRQPGAFEKVGRAIELLEQAQVPVKVKSNLTALNVRERPELEARFDAHPLVQLGFATRLFPRDDGDRTPELYRLSEAQERATVRAQLAGVDAERLGRVLERARDLLAADDASIVPCQAARTTFALQPNGDVTPCTQSGGHVMGNVRQRPLREIWERSTVGDALRGLTLAAFEECAACPYRKLCSRCVALSAEETGRFTGVSAQVCQTTKVYWSEVARRADELGLGQPL